MSKTSIQWTEQTWNPVRGCSPVSPGCKLCYAERQGGRFAGPGRPFDGFIQIGKNGVPGPHWTGKVELIPHMLDVPLRRKIPTTYFVNSMSDLFHEGLAARDIDKVFAIMSQSPQHTFQVLTKRPRQMLEYMRAERTPDGIDEAGMSFGWCHANVDGRWPLPNVWLGVSVEDQQRADERIPELLQTPAAVRFLSVEPLLGPVDLDCIPTGKGTGDEWAPVIHMNPLSRASVLAPHVHWVIVGGESGPGARPCNTEWIRSIVKQCQAVGVPVFVKQLGAKPYEIVGHGFHYAAPRHSPPVRYHKFIDRKGGDMSEWPHDIRIREMPLVTEFRHIAR